MTPTALLSLASAAIQRLAGETVPIAAAPPPVPQTAIGRALEALFVALGYALVLVPIAVVVAEVRRARRAREAAGPAAAVCGACGVTGHAPDAAYCRRCGERLTPAAGTRP